VLAVKRNATYRNGLCIYHQAIVPGETDSLIVVRVD
jgi:hypothetical protein